jgi:hypothetical protein
MQAIINAIDKATKAGVYDLNEVLSVAKQLEQLGEIVQQHQAQQEAMKSPPKNNNTSPETKANEKNNK